jgi:hypothetical protein
METTMFIRSKEVNGVTYRQLVEGYRDEKSGRVRHRTIVSLGRNASVRAALAAEKIRLEKLKGRRGGFAQNHVAQSKANADKLAAIDRMIEATSARIDLLGRIDEDGAIDSQSNAESGDEAKALARMTGISDKTIGKALFLLQHHISFYEAVLYGYLSLDDACKCATDVSFGNIEFDRMILRGKASGTNYRHFDKVRQFMFIYKYALPEWQTVLNGKMQLGAAFEQAVARIAIETRVRHPEGSNRGPTRIN